jgi:hypothetical protein
MRLGLFERVRRFARIGGRSARPSGPPGSPGPAAYVGHVGSAGVSGYPVTPTPRGEMPYQRDPATHDAPAPRADSESPWSKAGSAGRHRRDGEPVGGVVGSVRAGSARARVREAPPAEQAGVGQEATRQAAAARASAGRASAGRAGVGRVRTRSANAKARGVSEARPGPVRAAVASAHASMRTRLLFAAPHVREQPATADGRRHCGTLERVIWRQWDAAAAPPPEVIAAIDRLAELPERIKTRLADGLDAIFVGPGGVPELDDMTSLRGVRLPSGHASWDVCAGAYGERKIVVGSRPSPTPDVMCHEIGHALDDIDSPPGTWQSDSAEFRMLYDQCQPHFASDFHRQPGGLGRKEFFADAFAAIASGQRPALVDMLSGETRTALRVMLFFNRRYDI